MVISYSPQTTIVVPNETGLSIDVRTIMSPTTRVYGVRTFFEEGSGTRRNFFSTSTYYGVGQIVGKWEGYVVYQSYLEFSKQYHFTGYATDVQSEVFFLYPDSQIPGAPESSSEHSKVNDENGNPMYSYTINQEVVNLVGTSVSVGSDFSGAGSNFVSVGRLVAKKKDRLYGGAIPVDTLEIEVMAAEDGVSVDIIMIR